jgi:hypothetical protein
MPLLDISDHIGSWIYNHTKAKTYDEVKSNQITRLDIAGGLYRNTSQTERVMRLLKFLEPVCLAFSLMGMTGALKTQSWFKSSRVLITVIVRVPKAINAGLNPKINVDEDGCERFFRRVAGPCYGSLAVASALAEMVKLDLISTVPGVNKFLTYGTFGNLLAGAGGLYSWHRYQQRVYAVRKRDDSAASDIKKLEKARFGQLANGLRYSLEGLVGLGTMYGLKYTPWQTVFGKGIPAFIGVYAGGAQDLCGW